MLRQVSIIAIVVGASCAKPLPCNYYGCEGCCAADGTCVQGTTSEACGVDGQECRVCAGKSQCVRHVCTVVSYEIHLSITVDGQPCSQADVLGADTFVAIATGERIVPSAAPPLVQGEIGRWFPDCGLAVNVLDVPLEPPSWPDTMTVYGKRAGVDVLKGSSRFRGGEVAVDLQPFP